jgi:hypothetical protein
MDAFYDIKFVILSQIAKNGGIEDTTDKKNTGDHAES